MGLVYTRSTRQTPSYARNMLTGVVRALIFWFGIISAISGTNLCSSGGASTCAECLLLGPFCGWCSQENFSEGEHHDKRCDLVSNLLEKGCSKKYIEFPMNQLDIIKNHPISGKVDGSSSSIIQMSPQKISLRLRPGSRETFQVEVEQLEGYPVDLYYLMDLSASMFDDLQNIKSLGTTLATKMGQLSRNFRIGFGTFVDKPLSPYIKTLPIYQANPCTGYIDCLPVFGFNHVLPLTGEATEFNAKVKEQLVSGNIDSPEGGFDAILQVAVCKDKIGWRSEAMHLLVFVSDADSHIALDGRLAGVAVPNDGLCHLDEKNAYTHSTDMDYPSLGQLIEKLTDNNIQLIFAVTGKWLDQYANYSTLIPGATFGQLNKDSTNVQDLIIKAYKGLRSEVELEVKEQLEGVKLYFTALCHDGTVLPGQKKCTNLREGDKVRFNVSVELTSCLPGKHTLLLKPVGLRDVLQLEVTAQCGCQCEAAPEISSPRCTAGNGDYTCGVCTCSPGRLGPRCECASGGGGDEGGPGGGGDGGTGESERECRPEPEAPACSGRGDCFCGTCQCHSSEFGRIYGQHCECDNFSCAHHNSNICAGHGECECGECHCHEGWAGESCNCSTSTDACVTPSGLLCGGCGDCVCGHCVCTTLGASGDKCERCPSDADPCSAKRDCVKCMHFETGRLNETCGQMCKYMLSVVAQLPDSEDVNPNVCTFSNENNCSVQFMYSKETAILPTLYVLKEMDCHNPPSVMGIIVGVTVGVVIIGFIVLLLWKMMVTIHDRREFAKFQEDRSHARWGMSTNPLYRPTTSTFRNVSYRGTKSDDKSTVEIMRHDETLDANAVPWKIRG
ncbi:integrin beta-6-like [Lampetra fluviatilis]